MTELLAPAGNLECALAAFDEGADAVYAGLKKFNARERTENFSMDEMSRLITYAHKHDRRVYVTFNTLVKEEELEEAAEELSLLEMLRPDALIMQDIGMVRLARMLCPSLSLHGSTQMSLHNSAGLAFAKELGLSRVILERQTTLPELSAMMQTKPPVEVEIFVHGALCCCISGTCLLSSWLGGWSGNRGKCKQPCRRRHHSENGNGFFLSAQDLETLEILPDLLKTGVSAFKIEGRLRRSDYVSHVVAAYRMAMDAAAVSPEEFRRVLPEARARLARTLGRKWSLGYYTKESAEHLIKHDTLGVSGLLCGKAEQIRENGFTLSAIRPLYEGDMIRVQPSSGDEGPAFRLTRMKVNGRNTAHASRGEKVFLFSDKEIPVGGLVYKIGEKTPDYSKRIAQLPPAKPILDLSVFLSRTELKISANGKGWVHPVDLAEAEKQPLSPDRVAAEFRHLNSDRFETGRVQVQIQGNPFLPASTLKALRKEWESAFLAGFQYTQEDAEALRQKRMESFRSRYREQKGYAVSGEKKYSALVPRRKNPELPGKCSIVREYFEDPAPSEELLLPFYINEFSLPEIREVLKRYIGKGGHVIRISSLSHLPLLKPYSGLTVKTFMPLPVCNSLAAAELKDHGVSLVQGSLELGAAEWRKMAKKSPVPMELYDYGRPVLLSTRAELPVEGRMTDSKGDGFFVKRHGILTQIMSDKVMSIPPLAEAAALFYDYRNALPGEHKKGRFNFDVTLA